MAGPPSLLERVLTIAGAGVGGLGASASFAALGTQGPLALTMVGVAGAAVTAASALGGHAQRAKANEVAAFVERLVEQQGEWRRGLNDLLTKHQIDLAALPVDHRENPLVQFALLLTGTQEQIVELLETQASLAASLQRSVERQLPDISAHAKLTLQNVRAVLLAQKQQVQRMDAFALDLEAVRESTTRRPTLTLPQASEVENNEVGNPFIFSERFVPLVGRDDLMQRLHAFLEKPQISSKAQNDRFAWWWLHGEGGSGKSRLAHELCIDARAAGWDAGRLETNEPFDDWRRWEIRRDTLMVIDYAGDRAEQTATIIDALAKDAARFEHRVRVLLLDRARTDALDRRLKQGVTAGGQNAIARSEHVGASELPPLPPGDVEALIGFAHFWFKGEMPDLDRSFRLLTERIDPKPSDYDPAKTGRPWAPRALYACVLGYAIAQMGLDKVDAWDGDELLDWVLQEEQRHWAGARVKPTHVNAAVLATLIGGLELPVDPESPYVQLVPETLPACGGADLDGLTHVAGFAGAAPESSGDVANAIPSLAPVTPDILGERFVLDRLRGSLCADREPGHEAQRDTRALLDAALRTDPKPVTEFIERAMRDFPRHGASGDLWAPVVEEGLPPDTRAGVLGLAAARLFRTGQGEDSGRLFERLKGLHDLDPSSQVITASYVDVLHVVANAAAARAEYRQALAMYEVALGADRYTFGAEHERVAASLNWCGTVVFALGDAAGAIERFKDAERIDRAVFGDDHPNVATRVNNVGSALQALGDASGALSQYREAERIDRAVFGDDHPNVAIRVNNVGGALQALGDASGARDAVSEALHIFIRSLGPCHPNVVKVALNLTAIKGDPIAVARDTVDDDASQALAAAIVERLGSRQDPDPEA
ncbi:MAG: tetratricopeptide repeat protein [Planctomycetota bacterium]